MAQAIEIFLMADTPIYFQQWIPWLLIPWQHWELSQGISSLGSDIVLTECSAEGTKGCLFFTDFARKLMES